MISQTVLFGYISSNHSRLVNKDAINFEYWNLLKWEIYVKEKYAFRIDERTQKLYLALCL